MQDHGGQQHKDDDVHPKLAHQRPDAHDTQRDHELPRGNSEHVNEKADVLTEHQILRIEVGGQRGQRNDGDQDSLERVQQWAEIDPCEQRSQHHVDTEHHASQHKGLFHVAVLGAIFIFVVVGEQRVVVRISERAGQQQEAFVEARLDTGSSQAGVDVDECTVGVYQRGNDNDCQQTVNNHP